MEAKMKRCVLAILLFIPISVFGGDLEDGRAAISSRDYAKARTLLTPLAEAGNPVAQNAVGVLYTEGWGVKQDYSVALAWYRRAANSGDARGQYNLGRMYDNGWGVQKDHREAGKGVERNRDKAETFLKQAATQGSKEATEYFALQRNILQFILALDSDKDCNQRKLVNTELVIPPTSANNFTAVERWTLDRCGKP